MPSYAAPLVLVAALFAAGLFAIYADDAPRATTPATPYAAGAPAVGEVRANRLPPNHLALGGLPTALSPPDHEEATMTWSIPATWTAGTNASPMRIGTYLVPRARPDGADGDLSIMRAGGTAEANIQRWIGQFDYAGQETRTVKAVRGIKVTIVALSGTFMGGGMTPGAPAVAHPGWSLLAAIAEPRGSPYFFKLTGETAVVDAARASFAALVDSVTPI